MAQKKTLVQVLHQHSDHVKPGWYRVGYNYAWHIRSPVPQTLATSKRIVLKFNTNFRQNLIQLMQGFIIPPLLAYVPSKNFSIRAKYSQLLLSSHGDVKLFDPIGLKIKTYLVDPKKQHHLLKAQEILGRHFPIASLSRCSEEGVVHEPLINGTTYGRLTDKQKKEIYLSFLSKMVEMASCGNFETWGNDKAQAVFDSITYLTRSLPVYGLFSEHEEDIIKLLGKAAIVPAHRDLHSGNILVNAEGVKIIDLECFGYMPFFYDALSLPFLNALYSDDYSLLSRVVEGDFNYELDLLFMTGSGMKFSNQTSCIWLTYLILQIHYFCTRSHSKRYDLEFIKRRCEILMHDCGI